jgi:hypothetical protein
MGAAILLIAGCMLLPFLPGPYDGLAVTLSLMSQLFGTVGLLLVPIGAIWLVHDVWRRAATGGAAQAPDMGYWLALSAIGASTLIAAIISLSAFVNVGFSLGVGMIALWTYCVARLVANLRATRRVQGRRFSAAPVYLVVLPIVAALVRISAVDSAAEFSRNRVIANSARLIGDIERYHSAYGQYPRSLLSVWKDYKPSVIGVGQYHYEPNGDAYNVYFEQLSPAFGTREFVMYNKRDEHEMTSHAMDLLLLAPADLDAQRGYYAVHEASRPHWKRFLFD